MQRPAIHPVEQFRERLSTLSAYPEGVVPVPEYLNGTAFFSAAAGLTLEDANSGLPRFPFGGIMFVGHNLDSESAFRRRLATGRSHGDRERPMLTWRNLYRLLEAADIRESTCFFTNAFVGLKAGDNPVGPFPGATVPTFRAWCRAFLEYQVGVMRPRAIVSLGSPARRFVGELAPELSMWRSARNLPPAVVRADVAGHPASVAPLLHPAGYHGSLGRRHYGAHAGLAAEAALVLDALQ